MTDSRGTPLDMTEWRLQHDLLNTLRDVADAHYTPRVALEIICRDFGHKPLPMFGQGGGDD